MNDKFVAHGGPPPGTVRRMTPTPHLRYFVSEAQPGIPVSFKLKQWWDNGVTGEWRGIDQRSDTDGDQKDPP
jgi:hypothetical protein